LPGSITQKLVASRVGQHDVPVLGSLPDVDVAGTEPDRRGHRVPLVVEVGAGQVQVHPVRAELAGAARYEPQAELGVPAR